MIFLSCIKNFSSIAGQSKGSTLPVKTTRRVYLLYSRTAFIFLNFVVFLSVRVETAAQQTYPAGVEIKTAAHPQTATIGDRISIDLDIRTPQDYRVEIPEPEQQINDFSIFNFSLVPDIQDTHTSEPSEQTHKGSDASPQPHKARIIAAIYKTGTFTFPGIPVFITDTNGVRTEIQSPPVDIKIQSILSEKDQAPRDLKKQADIAEKIRWLFWTLIVVSFCFLSAAAWYLWRRYRKSPVQTQSTPAQDPLDLAESDLRNLIVRNLPQNGHTKRFYILLSEIVRRILEAAYKIPTAEQTTIEIMDSLLQHSGLGRDNRNTIEAFLLQCDIVKFAKYIPSTAENENAVENAFRILGQARDFGTGLQ